MKLKCLILWMGITAVAGGCQTVPKGPGSGLPEDLQHLAGQVQNDPEARSAVSAVNSSFKMQGVVAKYCPVDGKHFSSQLEDCPVHKVKLVPIE